MSDAQLILESEQRIRGSALFGRERTTRREIRRWWVENPQRWVAWLMLNPSDAGESRNDPTALRVTHFTQAWGYDGWIGVNLYPFISSDPKAMWRWAKQTAPIGTLAMICNRTLRTSSGPRAALSFALSRLALNPRGVTTHG